MRGWLHYGTKNLQVVPLMPGTPVYKDGTLSTLYYRTKEEGNLEVAFHESDMTHDRFIAFFELLKTLQVLCQVSDNKDLKPVGYSWVSNPVGVDGARAAVAGFCFFGDAARTKVARDLGMLGIAYWMIDLKIDVLHGVILESNFAAKNYAQKLGFVETAVVPKWRYVGGELVSVRNMTLEATEFLPRFDSWRLENPIANPA